MKFSIFSNRKKESARITALLTEFQQNPVKDEEKITADSFVLSSPKNKKRRVSIKVYYVGLFAGIFLLMLPFISYFIRGGLERKMLAQYNGARGLTAEEKANNRKIIRAYQRELKNGSYLASSGDAGRSYTDMLNLPDMLAELIIPTLHEKIAVYYGSGEHVMRKGVGVMENSSLPFSGVGSNCILVGHRGTYDANLLRYADRLKKGDHIMLDNGEECRAYRVQEISVCKPDDTSKLKLYIDKERVTLLTCTPYLINSHRLIINCDRDQDFEAGGMQELIREWRDKGENALVPASEAANAVSDKSVMAFAMENIVDNLKHANVQPFIIMSGVILVLFIIFLLVMLFALLIYAIKKRTRQSTGYELAEYLLDEKS